MILSTTQRKVLEKAKRTGTRYELHFTLGEPRLYFRDKWGWEKVARNTFNSLIRRKLLSLERGYGSWYTITPTGIEAIGKGEG